MTETTTGTNKAKTAKHSASPFGMPDYGMPKFGMPKFDLPKMEMPEAFREMAEKGVAQAKDNYQKIQSAAEGATDLLNSAYATAAKGTTDYNRKVIEIAGTNAHAALDYAYELLGVKSPSEFIELVDRACTQAVRGDGRADQGAHGTRPEGDDRDRC